MGVMVAVFVVLGLVSIVSPKISWWLSNGWKFSGGAEPSSLSLWIYRIGGVVLLLAAIFLIRRTG